MNKVQEALKAAIEAIDGEVDVKFMIKALALCKSALSEIEKCDPVGEVGYFDNGELVGYLRSDIEILPDTKLYTSPISKEWVDVPYEERRELYKSVSKGNIDGFADLLSAKLKQLNAAPTRIEREDWQYFDEAYKKATESSEPDDWMNAALMAQQVRRKQLNAKKG